MSSPVFMDRLKSNIISYYHLEKDFPSSDFYFVWQHRRTSMLSSHSKIEMRTKAYIVSLIRVDTEAYVNQKRFDDWIEKSVYVCVLGNNWFSYGTLTNGGYKHKQNRYDRRIDASPCFRSGKRVNHAQTSLWLICYAIQLHTDEYLI